MVWRKWNNILHRDIGYLAFGLTIVYGVSGVAVNHREHWNPSYGNDRTRLEIAPVLSADRDSIVSTIRTSLGLTEAPVNTFRHDSHTIQLFYEGVSYAVDLPTGKILRERVMPRPVLFEFNQLHLNTPRGLWTYLADLYALSLIALAVTGLFVLKGAKGITGRGAWLTALGVLLPAMYWVYVIVSD